MTEETALNLMQHSEQRELPHLPRLQLTANLASWKDFFGDESGQDMIEYVLAAALISLVAISAMKGLSTKISSAYSSISTNLTSDT
jgi:Flp pilus assembly pilin Flp